VIASIVNLGNSICIINHGQVSVSCLVSVSLSVLHRTGPYFTQLEKVDMNQYITASVVITDHSAYHKFVSS